MTTAILQETLARALATVSKAVASRTTLPILSHVLLQASGDELMVCANDFEKSIVTWAPIQPGADWDLTIPHSLLSDFVGQLPRERIDLEAIESDMSLALTCGRNEANIKGMDSKEFPKGIIEVPPEWTEIELPDNFGEQIKRVAFAAAKDEARPVFTGVAIVMRAASLVMVAADGFRMSVNDMGWNCPDEVAWQIEQNKYNPSYIIPAPSLMEVANIVEQEEAELSMFVGEDGRKVAFVCGRTVLASALIEGDYPDYARIVPEGHSVSVTIDRRVLLDAVRVSNLFAADSANIVKFDILPPTEGGRDGRVRLFAQSAEMGDNEVKLPAEVVGETLEIALNTIYVMDALKAVSDYEQVCIEFGSPSTPVKLQAVGLDGWQHIIMPMHI